MYQQYGKPSAPLLLQKKSFIEENVKHLNNQRNIASIYIQQPIRKNCKNCDQKLSEKNDFVKDRIGYKICPNCTHLNGANEDTNEFCETAYSSDDGKNYAENYVSENIESYNYRVATIYVPKAEFLATSLRGELEDPFRLEFLDFGAGSGYFVRALDSIGLKKVFGSEVSKAQVNLGNQMIGRELLRIHNLKNTAEVLSKTKANVVSMIGVLEHLQDPRGAIEAIRNNDNVKYFYISVPLFSLSVYVEMISKNRFHRQLHGTHTHLYTETSIAHLAEEFGFDIVSQWWFGTDMVDLYRNVYIDLEETGGSDSLRSHYQNMMKSIIDAMQLEIDKKHYSSEVHVLFKKRELSESSK
ncbi:class I SAM-dependent methyltransferase [Leptospira kmetyi]|uniref:class I SAM-dependent methyltransferase n=1 Tax=Leptospira kmetyi TaxID=408139 RepID=UPI003EC0A8A1